MKTKTMQHLNPIFREKTDFIIGAKCNYKSDEYDMVWEQLWVKKISEFRFEICCIPFYVYDLALGDEVITDKNYMITEVVKPSGHYTFRVWFGNSQAQNIRDDLLEEITNAGCLYEWYSGNLLGIDCIEKTAQQVANILYEKEMSGLLNYETGRKA
jgi:hypothetical protein